MNLFLFLRELALKNLKNISENFSVLNKFPELKSQIDNLLKPEYILFEQNAPDQNKLKEVKSVDELPYEFDIEETNLDYYIKIHDRWNENESQKLFDIVFELDK